MGRSDDRVRRLQARRVAKQVLGPLRTLVAVLAEWERLDGVDAIGVVQIDRGTIEADYAADLLDITAQAVSEAAVGHRVEVFVTLTPINQSIAPRRIGGSTDGRKQRRSPDRV